MFNINDRAFLLHNNEIHQCRVISVSLIKKVNDVEEIHYDVEILNEEGRINTLHSLKFDRLFKYKNTLIKSLIKRIRLYNV